LRLLIKDLEEKLTIEFKLGVEKINKQFNSFFSLMFGGGNASLQVIRDQKRKRKPETDLLGELMMMAKNLPKRKKVRRELIFQLICHRKK
jgi:chromosome segregation ATPase